MDRHEIARFAAGEVALPGDVCLAPHVGQQIRGEVPLREELTDLGLRARVGLLAGGS